MRKSERSRTITISSLALAAFLGLFATVTASANASFLTFDNFYTGTLITDQYEGEGVLFSGQYETPEIAWDESNGTSPVLRGGSDFYEPIYAKFVAPGTTTPGTIDGFSVDVGYINDLYSTEVVVHTTHGDSTIYLDEYGIDTVYSSVGGITGFDVAASEEGAGFAIDNLSFTPPAASPKSRCAKYLVIDSRGSGEPRYEISAPGKEFLKALKGRLKALGNAGRVLKLSNPYPAVGVFSLIDPRKGLNGLGAFLHKDQIGAYRDSEREGERELRSLVTNQIGSFCGSSKIILVGYSQGAEVAGDVYQGLSRLQRKHIAAVVLFGDPRYNHRDHDADQDRRTLDGSLGIRPKFPHNGATRLFSYCRVNDPICQWRLPLHTLIWHRMTEHHQYWAVRSSSAEDAGHRIADFLSRRR